jgi:hypothetical protein
VGEYVTRNLPSRVLVRVRSPEVPVTGRKDETYFQADTLLGLSVLKDRRDMFLRNVRRISKDRMALYLRRQCSNFFNGQRQNCLDVKTDGTQGNDRALRGLNRLMG